MNKDMQSLVEKAWQLQCNINLEINKNAGKCRSGHRGCPRCDGLIVERERLMAVRESMRDIEEMLTYLQRLRSWQLLDRHSALAQLKESKSHLIENIARYQGRTQDIIEELRDYFGVEKTCTALTMRKCKGPQLRLKTVTGFLAGYIKLFFNPSKWHEAVGIAAKLVVFSASLSSVMPSLHSRKMSMLTKKKFLSLVYSRRQRSLDVVNGMG